ncbi:hypothetical protein [Rhodococcus marinonascens]|uniref:hypothetical protein n=1 Tax=Rhodococcus marinonascens TaxID=38311 RepID=UPI0009344BE0|nr:hypothetical protein [Rhodococcus marinonascens]
MSAAGKPSAFAAPRGAAPSVKPHPFTPQLAREAAATPPTLPKDAKLAAFATRLPPDLQRLVKTACAQRGIRMQDAVYEALWQWLNNQEPRA